MARISFFLLPRMLIALVFFTPLLYTHFTYELFEFPKMFLVYFLAIASLFLFLIRNPICPWPFPPTPLDRPLVLFLISYFLSTLFSQNLYTSLFGYFSRFNGGLFSVLAFVTLYYLSTREAFRLKSFAPLLRRTVLFSAFLVSLLGIAQHFGYQKGQWVQDSSVRVFSTVGQPNWLAAFLVMVLPLSLAFLFSAQGRLNRLLYLGIFLALYSGFWYTFSLSGIFGLAGAFSVFLFLTGKHILRENFKTLILIFGMMAGVSLLQPGLFAPRFENFWREIKTRALSPAYAATQRPAAFESDTFRIRLLVWQGAFTLLQKDRKALLVGTGPETFAYTFLPYRPATLNLTSEWDFLYNKAHNDYLDILVTRGSLGFLSSLYLLLTFAAWTLGTLRRRRLSPSARSLLAAFFSGWLGLLLTNAFGWSVAATSLLFWLYPVLAFETAGVWRRK